MKALLILVGLTYTCVGTMYVVSQYGAFLPWFGALGFSFLSAAVGAVVTVRNGVSGKPFAKTAALTILGSGPVAFLFISKL
jgi:hypothetical protein